MGGLSALGAALGKLLRSGGVRGGRRYCVAEVEGRLCIGKLLYQGLLRDVVLSENICGVEVDIVRQPLGPVLRRLRADILSMEVMLEKRYDVMRSEELELLKIVEKRIAREGSPARVVVRLKVCDSADPVREELEAYGCRVRTRCVEGEFFRVRRRGAGYYAPLGDVVDEFAELLRRLEPLLSGEGEAAIPIGFEPRSRYLAWLSLAGPEGAHHSLIVGPTGRGKTTLLSLVAALAVLVGLSVYIVDFKGDLGAYTELLVPRELYKNRVFLIDDPREAELSLKALIDGARSIVAPRLHSMVLVDEAWSVRRTLLASLYRVGRSIGVSAVAATQHPADIGGDIWNNSYNLIIFPSSDAEYMNVVARRAGVQDLKPLSASGVGEALIQRGRGGFLLVRLFNPFRLMGIRG